LNLQKCRAFLIDLIKTSTTQGRAGESAYFSYIRKRKYTGPEGFEPPTTRFLLVLRASPQTSHFDRAEPWDLASHCPSIFDQTFVKLGRVLYQAELWTHLKKKNCVLNLKVAFLFRSYQLHCCLAKFSVLIRLF